MLSLSLWVDAGCPSVLPEPQEQSTLLMGLQSNVDSTAVLDSGGETAASTSGGERGCRTAR